MSTEIFTCRLCDRLFHSELDVIHLFSDEGKKLEVAPKILFTLSIMISENDPLPKHICRVCLGHVDVNVRFANTCRSTNQKHLRNLLNVSKNYLYKNQTYKVMNLPIPSLYYKQYATIKGVYEDVVQFMKTQKCPQTTPGFELEELSQNPNNKSISYSNGIRNMYAIKLPKGFPLVNGTPQSSNTPVTNVPTCNMITVNKISNSSVSKKNQFSNGPIINKLKHKLLANINNKNQSSSTNKLIGINSTRNNLDSDIGNKNQSNTNGLRLRVNNNDHTYGSNRYQSQSDKNGTKHSIDDEIICVDDDDDDDDVQVVDDGVHPLNHWVTHNCNETVEMYKTSTKLNDNPQNRIQFQRKLIPALHRDLCNTQSENSSHSSNTTISDTRKPNTPTKSIKSPSNVLSEEMTVTPDMPFESIDDTVNSLNQKLFYVLPSLVPSKSTESFVSPDTGFHFLFSSETVDLTSKDTTEISKTPGPSTSKRKNRKDNHKNVAPPTKKRCCSAVVPTTFETTNSTTNRLPLPTPSSTITSEKFIETVSTSRPKRASALAANPSVKNSGLWKLGKQSDLSGWKVHMDRIMLPLHHCPICETYFWAPKSRQAHETLKHFLPDECINESCESIPTLENATSNEQQEFLMYLNLVKQMSIKLSVTDKIAKRTHLLKALEKFGNADGSYDCQFCKYKTTRMFILWAHMSTHHVLVDADKKTNAYCFVCDRVLGKRSKLLKHLDKCAESHPVEVTESGSSIGKLSCNYCNDDIKSLSHLETHLWEHSAV